MILVFAINATVVYWVALKCKSKRLSGIGDKKQRVFKFLACLMSTAQTQHEHIDIANFTWGQKWVTRGLQLTSGICLSNYDFCDNSGCCLQWRVFFLPQLTKNWNMDNFPASWIIIVREPRVPRLKALSSWDVNCCAYSPQNGISP